MTDDLYERYKEALRVGHVAVLRGALQEAGAAYRTASEIAPSRALPHTSLGGVLLRLGHLEEALVEYAAAVARAPHDEGALLGQAEALTMAGQRADAAAALDHVSEIQESVGRLPEAADTLRRALELDESPERARRQRGLLREIRLSEGDAAAEQLLARALRLRDEPASEALATARSAMADAPIGGPAVGNPMVADGTANPTPAIAAAAEVAPWLIDRAVESVVPAGSDQASHPTSVEYVPAGPEPSVVDGQPAENETESEPGAAVPAAASIDPPATQPARPDAEVNTLEPAAAAAAQFEVPVPRSAKGIEWPAELEWPIQDRARRFVQAPEAAAVASVDWPMPASPEVQPVAGSTDDDSSATLVPMNGSFPGSEPAAAATGSAPAIDSAVTSAALQDQVKAIGVMDGVFDTIPIAVAGHESDNQPSGDELLAAAEAAEQAGDDGTLRSLLVWTARAYTREGRFEAGLDATHRLLQRDPGDVDAHLVLVELYVARNWNGLAAEKLALLGKLAELNHDQKTRDRVCAVASRAFPNDEHLGALCA